MQAHTHDTKNKTASTVALTLITAVLLTIGYFIYAPILSTRETRIPSLENEAKQQTRQFVGIVASVEQFADSEQSVITTKNPEGNTIQVQYGQVSSLTANARVEEGDWIRVNELIAAEGDSQYFFVDIDRVQSYYFIVAVFTLVVVAVSGWFGLRSIVSLILSGIFILNFIVPRIANGSDPISVALISGSVLLAILMLISHGLNKHMLVALLGAYLGVLLAFPLALLFGDWASITGVSNDAAIFLQLNADLNIDLYRLVLASMILGVLGVIDDATVSQVAIVQELKTAKPDMKMLELFSSAMKVGVSHIGSLVNTLFFTYVAVSLPLIVLVYVNSASWSGILGDEVFAEEIVRTAVGTIGLVASVPITTLIAAVAYEKGWLRSDESQKKGLHTH